MSGDFLDSNVFVYTMAPNEIAKRAVADGVVRNALSSGDGLISFQVVQEVLSVATSKLTATVASSDVADLLADVLVPLWRVSPSQALYRSALDLHNRHQFRFYDALIVAAALDAGCDRLLTEDLQHGQRIEGLTIHNPFL